MDRERETEIIERIAKLETRLNILEEKVRRLSQETTVDFSRPESESDEPIIDG